MIDYSDHHDYAPEDSDGYREGSSTPVLEGGEGRFHITEVGGEYNTEEEEGGHYDEYDINYVSGESGEEYIEEDAYMNPQEYGMCQPVYDSEDYSHSEGEAISGDEFDREEELRGYNRAIDFTLHTILEESCEDSEPENKAFRDRKRHSDPSELEKYFFYGVGGGSVDPNLQEESEYSSEAGVEEGEEDEEARLAERIENRITSRLEDYFMSGFTTDKHQSLDGISDRGNTDDSGSVGSESDGQPSPEHRRKKISRPKFRSERLSDRGESGAENNPEDESGSTRVDGNSSGDDDANAFVASSDNSFDTIKRKKNKGRKSSSEDRRSDGETGSVRSAGSVQTAVPALIQEEGAVKPAADLLPSEKETKDGKKESKIKDEGKGGRSSNKNSPSTSPPPVSGPVRKHKSRDYGFVGSNDDLLRNPEGSSLHTSSDDMQSGRGYSDCSEGEQQQQHDLQLRKSTRLEEVSENTEDDCDKSLQDRPRLTAVKSAKETERAPEGNTSLLARKDSFHQWSSDEETNIMMNRMRSFFKTMLVNASKGKPLEPTRKPTQIVYFEEQLTRLMKTVPGINDQQVKEIVEYLSSEDTWSDSYDSSDYTDYTSSDLEGAPFFTEAEDPVIPDMDVDVLEKLQKKDNTQATSLGEMVEQDEFQKETAIMYQKLMNSVAKMQQSQEEQKKENEAKRSP